MISKLEPVESHFKPAFKNYRMNNVVDIDKLTAGIVTSLKEDTSMPTANPIILKVTPEGPPNGCFKVLDFK